MVTRISLKSIIFIAVIPWPYILVPYIYHGTLPMVKGGTWITNGGKIGILKSYIMYPRLKWYWKGRLHFIRIVWGLNDF